MAAPQPEPTMHTGPWTLDEWLALPEGPPYTELVDGLLVISPVSAYPHQRLMVRLWQQLDAAAPAQYEVMPDSNVALGGDRALIPDICVIDRPGFDGVILSARHVVLVGEIASPSTTIGRPSAPCMPRPGSPTCSWSIRDLTLPVPPAAG